MPLTNLVETPSCGAEGGKAGICRAGSSRRAIFQVGAVDQPVPVIIHVVVAAGRIAVVADLRGTGGVRLRHRPVASFVRKRATGQGETGLCACAVVGNVDGVTDPVVAAGVVTEALA